MYDYQIQHRAYLNAIQACEDARISLGEQKELLLENVSRLKAENAGETIDSYENTVKTLVETGAYASACSRLEGMQGILEEELPRVNTLLKYINGIDHQLGSTYYSVPVPAGEVYAPPGEGKLALDEASVNAALEKCRRIQEINEEIRMRFRSLLISLEGYLPEAGELEEALEKACNKVNRIENLERAMTRYMSDVKGLTNDLKYRLALLTENPEEVIYSSGWNATTQKEAPVLQLTQGATVLKMHADELSNLEGVSTEGVIEEIEAYWNREDGYFGDEWWQDENKKREALNILLLESLLIEDENGNVGGYDLVEHYKSTEPGNPKRYALQILFQLAPTGVDDEIILNNIAAACSKRGIDLLGNNWVLPPDVMQFHVVYHDLLEQEQDMMEQHALSVISMGVDFVPLIGEVKSLIEAIGGKDLITGKELNGFERIFGIAAAFADVLLFAKWAKNGIKGIKHVDDITEVAYKSGDEVIGAGIEGVYKCGADVVDDITDVARRTQKSLIESVENSATGTKGLTNLQKGNYGEMKMDDFFESQGYDRISTDRVTDLNAPTHHGIDGVYYKEGPPPEYIIAESKYGTSKLSKVLADGTNQMDDDWIAKRIKKAIGKDAYEKYQVDKIIYPDCEKDMLFHINADCTVDKTILLIDGVPQE